MAVEYETQSEQSLEAAQDSTRADRATVEALRRVDVMLSMVGVEPDETSPDSQRGQADPARGLNR